MADPLPNLSPAELARYSRHILLDELGVEGQRKLAAARVLVIGAGGLGSPAALYLAAAGVGTLGIADFDRVEEHNLQRQLLHDSDAVGQPKTESAARRLRTTNPHIRVIEHSEGITVENAVGIFSGYDVIVDGTDRFSARYLNNDAAFFARRPLIYGSVFKFEGQVAVFDTVHGGPCYRCLFPQAPEAGSVPGCGEAGVLGALCGMIGSLQALETIKLITGVGRPLVGRLLTYNALQQDFQTLTLKRDPGCPLCSAHAKITALLAAEYSDAACATPASPPPAEEAEVPIEVAASEAHRRLAARPEATLLIDVREPYEWEICHVANSEHIPMRQIPGHAETLPRDKHLFIICHSGMRSMRVTEFLRDRGFEAVSNVAGGVDAWAAEVDPTMRRY